MKKFLLGTIGALFGLQAQATQNAVLSIHELRDQGFNTDSISEAFEQKFGIQLTADAMISVSYEKEGDNIRFDTLDHLSVVVPVLQAKGTQNKEAGGARK